MLLSSRCRKLLAVLALLFVLQAIFLLYSPLLPHTAVCRGPGCAAPAAAASLTGRLRSLLTGQAATAPQPSGTPPNWTLARPDEWSTLINSLYDYVEKPHASCRKSVRVGGQADYKWRHFDGYKWLCLDPEYDLVQTDRCLIYSFGVDHDWSFDDNAQLLECEIHAFDPSIGQRDHKRSARIFFHNIGIGGRNEVKTIRQGLVASRRWDIRTYEEIVRFLGHENRTVHYLKVDVEGSEWDMFAHIFEHSAHLLRNVKQIGMEVHMAFVQGGKASLDAWKRYFNTFMQLERLGFRLFHSEVNPYEARKQMFSWTKRPVSRVYELVWLNQPW